MAVKNPRKNSEPNSVCNLRTFFPYTGEIRPLRVGSLDHPERYRNLGAFAFATGCGA